MGESFKLALVYFSSPAALQRQAGREKWSVKHRHLSKWWPCRKGHIEIGGNGLLTTVWWSTPVHGDYSLPLQHKYNVYMRHTEIDKHIGLHTPLRYGQGHTQTNTAHSHKQANTYTHAHTHTHTHPAVLSMTERLCHLLWHGVRGVHSVLYFLSHLAGLINWSLVFSPRQHQSEDNTTQHWTSYYTNHLAVFYSLCLL